MDLKGLQEKIGFKFKHEELLKEAVTHRSYLNENPTWKFRNNERLEFLGDAVLELIVTEELFARLPDKEEGELTLYRAALVNSKMLTGVAEEIGLDRELLVSKGEARDWNGRGREAIAANAVEALIGGIYLDQGYEQAKKFVNKFIMPHLGKVVASGGKDPKSLVQEIAQEDYAVTPSYRVLDESGPAHERTFTVGLYFGDELKSKGLGASKQEAELEAAERLLRVLES